MSPYTNDINDLMPKKDFMDKYEQKEQSERHEMAYDDIKDLLKKYIKHVEDCEGINYIDACRTGEGFGGGFTQEEIDILESLEKEIESERKNG